MSVSEGCDSLRKINARVCEKWWFGIGVDVTKNVFIWFVRTMCS